MPKLTLATSIRLKAHKQSLNVSKQANKHNLGGNITTCREQISNQNLCKENQQIEKTQFQEKVEDWKKK